MRSKIMDRTTKFVPCGDSFGKDANVLSCSYDTVEEAKKAILKDLKD